MNGRAQFRQRKWLGEIIVGADAILQAVARCWESARSERALEYRRQQGLSVECVRQAVLVQQLVASDASAVVFSANPVTGSRDEVLINTSWGLGKSIFSGTVTPDTFVVRKSDLVVLDRGISDKQRMTVSAPSRSKRRWAVQWILNVRMRTGCCTCFSVGPSQPYSDFTM